MPTKKQSTAINVGAHDGLWCEKFSKLFARTIAIEANPRTTERLRARRLENVEVVDGAGWICSGQQMEFHVRHNADMSSALACRDILRDDGVSETITVSTIAIDDLKLTSCDLIWVDVEGAELQVIQGATRTIEAFKPQLMVECHEAEHREWLQTWLIRAGYNLGLIHEPQRELHQDWGRHVYLVASYYRYHGQW